MRILVQRVTSASVTVGGDVVGAISADGQGLLALVGVTHTTTREGVSGWPKSFGS